MRILRMLMMGFIGGVFAVVGFRLLDYFEEKREFAARRSEKRLIRTMSKFNEWMKYLDEMDHLAISK